MKVSICQFNLVWGSPEANCQEAARCIESCEPSDLYVLPEMWSTGFAVEPAGIAEIANDAEGCYAMSLQWMLLEAHKKNAAVAGSLAIKEKGKYYNRFYFVRPDGTFTIYNKRHLFTFGGEDKKFTRGNERVIVVWRGTRICLQVCYDLRFPVWMRNRKDYDLLLVVANWPVPRREPWDILVRARAIENQCYVVAVNRVGKDPSCIYNGGSVVVSPYGKIIAACENDKVNCVTADLNMETLEEFRKKFPVLEDADDFDVKKASWLCK